MAGAPTDLHSIHTRAARKQIGFAGKPTNFVSRLAGQLVRLPGYLISDRVERKAGKREPGKPSETTRRAAIGMIPFIHVPYILITAMSLAPPEGCFPHGIQSLGQSLPSL